MIALTRYLASLRLTLAAMALLAATSLATAALTIDRAWLSLPLSLLAANLLAALVARPVFHRMSGLLVFHVGLFALLLLASAGSLTGMTGRVEVIEGQALIDAAVEITHRGPLHRFDLEPANFTQGGIRVDYAPGLARRGTSSSVRIDGSSTETALSDNRPLEVGSYRFTTTSNKGYAALIAWHHGTSVQRGAVHFPSYPAFEWKQVNTWRSPSGTPLVLELVLPPIERQRPWSLATAPAGVMLAVREPGEAVTTLAPGQSMAIDGATLRFEDVRLWIGYEIDASHAVEWMFVAAVVAIAGIGVHFRRRLFGAGRCKTDVATGYATRREATDVG